MKSQLDFLNELNSNDENLITEVLFGVCKVTPHKSDVAIVLGCGVEKALDRADMAANFYLQGFTKLIITSGGVAHEFKGDSKKECEIMRGRLIEKGVPASAIVEEENSQNTIGNMVFSLGELCKLGFLESNFKSITIVTEPYHLKRSLLLASTYFPKYIDIYGYTEGAEEQETHWSSDVNLKKCVDTEIYLLTQLIENGRVYEQK
ncbi:MAG: YdcF family protein [Muribaculaceae bacterium]|nr:YdcF family protein [Muribaculaceae bacterium]